MTSLSSTNHYAFHGVRLAFSGPPEALAPLHVMFRQFQAGASPGADIVLEFPPAPAWGPPQDRPWSAGRLVFDQPLVEAYFDPREDVFYLRSGEQMSLWCCPSAGYMGVSVHSLAPGPPPLPFHAMFNLAFREVLKRRGYHSLHAAGLCLRGKGLLLAGASGAGKSTLTLALLRAGFGFMGDDTLFLRQTGDGVRALAFPEEIDVTDDTVRLFPELRPLLAQPKPAPWPKRQVWAEETYGVDFVPECTPAVLVVPRVAHTQQSVLTPLRQNDALLELAPNVLLTDPRASQAHFDALGELVRQCQCYRLDTGRDLDAVPALLRGLLDERM